MELCGCRSGEVHVPFGSGLQPKACVMLNGGLLMHLGIDVLHPAFAAPISVTITCAVSFGQGPAPNTM